MKIDRGVLPMKTAEELEADMKAEAAERALAAREVRDRGGRGGTMELAERA